MCGAKEAASNKCKQPPSKHPKRSKWSNEAA